jgi:hypothetical protein
MVYNKFLNTKVILLISFIAVLIIVFYRRVMEKFTNIEDIQLMDGGIQNKLGVVNNDNNIIIERVIETQGPAGTPGTPGAFGPPGSPGIPGFTSICNCPKIPLLKFIKDNGEWIGGYPYNIESEYNKERKKEDAEEIIITLPQGPPGPSLIQPVEFLHNTGNLDNLDYPDNQ